MHLVPSHSEMQLSVSIGSNPNLVHAGEEVSEADRFSYLGDGRKSYIQKARLAFTKLRRRLDIPLSTKGRVYIAAVRSLLLYGSEA